MFKVNYSSSGNDMVPSLSRLAKMEVNSLLARYGQRGVDALQAATPQESGETARSWYYKIERKGRTTTLWWCNSHLDSEGKPVAILIQFGHATGTGGYVQGRDYINPALRPLFDQFADEIGKEVKGR